MCHLSCLGESPLDISKACTNLTKQNIIFSHEGHLTNQRQLAVLAGMLRGTLLVHECKRGHQLYMWHGAEHFASLSSLSQNPLCMAHLNDGVLVSRA